MLRSTVLSAAHEVARKLHLKVANDVLFNRENICVEQTQEIEKLRNSSSERNGDSRISVAVNSKNYCVVCVMEFAILYSVIYRVSYNVYF